VNPLSRSSLLVVGALVLALTGCNSGVATPSPNPNPVVTKLTVGLGYIPSVQFAPFYRAQRQGYYSGQGLDVTFQNEIDPNLITLVGQGAVDIGLADGTSVIAAVGQGIPIKYVGTVYAKFPNVVMTPASSGISDAAGLAGKSLGIPGRYGSSWIMLQALLASANLTPADLDIHDYPDYGQAVGLQQGQVESATGFRNNEPVMLGRQGFATNVLTIDEITPLPGPGLIVGVNTLATKHDAIEAFLIATLEAMSEVQGDPTLGLEDAIAVVPELGSDRAGQLAVLQATVEMWNPCCGDYTIMYVDRNAWAQSLDFMRTLPDSNIPADLNVDDLISEEFTL
jgi:putative riboflavin transport system substrate-binding protein